MSDIFISYASEDRERILPLVHALEKTGWSIFWDRTIPISKTWQQVIGEEVDNCKCMIVAWSSSSVQSEWVYEEAGEGKRRHILFPVLIDDVLPPLGFRSIQAGSFIGWEEEKESVALDKLIRDMSDILGEPPAEIEAKHKAEEEERKKADEAKRKEEEERRQQEKAEAKRKAEEEEREKAEEDKRKAEEEKRQQEEAEAKSKAEEKERRKAEETKRKQEEKRKLEYAEESRTAEEQARSHERERREGRPTEAIVTSPTPVPSGEVTSPQPPISHTPWFLIFLLPLLNLYYSDGPLRVELDLFAIPIAAWLGARYGRGGMLLVAIGFVPMLFGTPNFGGISLPIRSDVYIASLFVSYACAYPNWFWIKVENFNLTLPAIAAIFILGSGIFLFSGSSGSIGYSSDKYIIYIAAFIVGLMGRNIKSTYIIVVAIGLFGVWMLSVGLSKFSEDLGNGLKYVGGYRFDRISEIATVAIILFYGNQIGRALRGESFKKVVCNTSGYFLFYACWFYALISVSSSKTMVYSQSSLLLLFMAFVAGLLWQQKGKLILGVAIFLSVLLTLAEFRFLIGFSETFSLYFRVSGLLSYITIFIAAVVFFYFGLKLSSCLGLATNLEREKQELVSALFPILHISVPKSTSGYNPALVWLLVPLMPLLALTYKFSKRVDFSFYYLIVPLSAWLAYRYGRKALLPLSLGMITYWIGYRIGHISFRPSLDLYLMALIVAWAIAYPEKWIYQLSKIKNSPGLVFFMVAFLPLYLIVRMNSFEFGIYSYFIYPFILFVVGWSGASTRNVIPIIIIAGIVGVVLYMNGFSSSRPIYFYYDYRFLQDIVTALLSYSSGVVLYHFYTSYSDQNQSAWPAGSHRFLADLPQTPVLNSFLEKISSRKAFYLLAIVMGLVMLRIAIGVDGFKTTLWGDKWLFFLGAFMAGFIWRNLGYQLTSFAVAMAWLLSGVIMPSADGSIIFGSTDDIFIAMKDAGGRTFIFMSFTSFLYCYLGIKISESLTKVNSDKSVDTFKTPPSQTMKSVLKSDTDIKKTPYVFVTVLLLVGILIGIFSLYQSNYLTTVGVSDLSTEAQEQKVETLIKEASESINKASSVNGEWRDSSTLLKQAKSALVNGDLEAAEEYAEQAKFEGDQGYEQAVEQKNAGPWLF